MTFSPTFEEGDHPGVDETADDEVSPRDMAPWMDDEDETVETRTLTDAELLALALAERTEP